MKGISPYFSLVLCILIVVILLVSNNWLADIVNAEDYDEHADSFIWELVDGDWVSGGLDTEEAEKAALLHGLSGIKLIVRAIKIEVHGGYKTVKCNYSGKQSWSGAGRMATYDIEFTMTGTYTHPSYYERTGTPGVKGQYTYKAHIIDTTASGKTSSNDVSVKGSFLNQKPLTEGDYHISFGPGTGTWTDAKGTDSITVPSWNVSFTAQKQVRISGTQFSGISGVVEVLIPGEKGWRAATYDMKLPVGTHIKTEDDSTCVLSFADLSTFVLKPHCEIVLESPPDEDAKVDLIKGSVWSKVKEMFKTGTMEIEMNQAVTTIKGTTLVCEETGNTSTVKVIEGNVDFKSKKTGQTVNVNAGKMVTGTSAGLSSITSFDINQEQAKWQNIGASTSSSLLPQGSTSSQDQSSSSSSSGTTRKKIKIGPLSCFIATAAYGSETATELDTLRSFRDKMLMQSEPGRCFVDTYYKLSPPLAEFIAEHEEVRTLVRETMLDPIVFILDKSQGMWNN